MTYLAAPAVALLSTSCCLCGRALLDSASVTAGIGPVCRKKYGYKAEITDETRVAANALIHEAAIGKTPNDRRAEIAEELEGLGLAKVAAKIRDRFMKAAVTVTRRDVTFGKGNFAREFAGSLVVSTSYSPSFNEALKSTVDWRDRRPLFEPVAGKKDRFVGWAVKPGARKALWSLLCSHFAGKALQAPDGSISYIPVSS